MNKDEEPINVMEAIVEAIQNHVPVKIADISDDILARKILKAIEPFMIASPAAPVEGLETFSVEMMRDYAFMKADPDGDYVTRSQAEDIIAAERNRAEDAERDANEQSNVIIKLEADNAALTARVKELEGERDEAIRRGEDQWTGWVKEEVLRKALEIQLAAANKRADELESAWLKAEALLSEYQP